MCFSLFCITSCIDDPEIQEDTPEGNFEALWRIVDTRYCYLDSKNINWDSIYAAYTLRLPSVGNDKIALFDLMAEMLAELKDGHVNLYSSFDRSRYWKWFTDYPSNFNSGVVYGKRYLGDNYRIAAGLRYARIENGRIGYVYYSSFSDTFTDSNMSDILSYFQNCEGLIIDVRNNGGGYADLSDRLASYFMDSTRVSAYIKHKTGAGHSAFSKPTAIKTTSHKTIQWRRPVVVLSNRMSYSATNLFVCRMKPHFMIVGDKTGGGGGLPMSSELPNGWMIRFSASPMYDADMNDIEWGIEPDIRVDLKPEDADAGIDTIIESAIELITNEQNSIHIP